MNNNCTRQIALVSIIYVIFSGLWIFFSDYILNQLITDKNILTSYQTYKGMLFVAISGILIIFLIRKLVKQAVFDCSGDLLRITDNMMDIIIETDAKGVLVYASPSVNTTLGYIPKDTLGKSVFDFIHPEDQERALTVLIAVSETGEPGRVDCRCRKADGKYMWIEAIGNPSNKKPGMLSLVIVCRDITRRKQMERELTLQRAYFQQLFTNSPEGIVIAHTSGEIIDVNRGFEELFKYKAEEAKGKNIEDIIVSQDLQEEGINLTKSVQEGKIVQKETLRKRKDNILVNVSILAYPIFIDNVYVGIYGIYHDITDSVRAKEELMLQKAYFQQLFENSPNGIVMMDNDERIVSINKGFEKLFQYKAKEASGQLINDLVVPENLLAEGIAFSNRIISGGVANQKDTVRKKKDGSLVNVNLLGYPIIVNNKQVGLYVIYSDITDRKNTEDKLKYLSLYDSLTGLYNRGYFEQEMTNLQRENDSMAGIILCDLDGLKLINDTMGHDTGDTLLRTAANILKNCFRETDIVARIGGDEFAVLLPGGTRSVVEKAIQRVKYSVKRYNVQNTKLPLSLSVGFAQGQTNNLEELFKEADNSMYREKLHHSQSARSAIVQTLLKAMEARDYITEGHGDRLQDLVVNLAAELGLPGRVMTDLRLFAQFHDVGKVGIPDRILFKKGPLTPKETKEMRRHSEIGHRIAQSAPDLVPIADWILKHHEWWNGQGYPLGLTGEDIPRECRILAIADAYDAMTNDRPYRKAMSSEEALKELQKCAGEQFDPLLVKIFVNMLSS